MTYILTLIMLTASGTIQDKQPVAVVVNEQICQVIGEATARALTASSNGKLFMYSCDAMGEPA